jgi:hypothetical protein
MSHFRDKSYGWDDTTTSLCVYFIRCLQITHKNNDELLLLQAGGAREGTVQRTAGVRTEIRIRHLLSTYQEKTCIREVFGSKFRPRHWLPGQVFVVFPSPSR